MVAQRVAQTTPTDDDRRSRAVRTFVLALAMTPTMVLSAEFRAVPFGVALVAVGVGTVAGGVTFLVADGVDLGDVSDAVAIGVALLGIVVGTIVVWLVVPSEHVPTFALGTLAFVWSVALAAVGRHVVAPRLRTVRP